MSDIEITLHVTGIAGEVRNLAELVWDIFGKKFHRISVFIVLTCPNIAMLWPHKAAWRHSSCSKVNIFAFRTQAGPERVYDCFDRQQLIDFWLGIVRLIGDYLCLPVNRIFEQNLISGQMADFWNTESVVKKYKLRYLLILCAVEGSHFVYWTRGR